MQINQEDGDNEEDGVIEEEKLEGEDDTNIDLTAMIGIVILDY